MPRILVVDDTAVDRQLAGGLLRAPGNREVDFAANGEEAIERMQQAPPDIVVTDLQMPEMDGLELVTRIRMQFPKVPVILMTAKGSDEIAVEALEQGAASYVPKSQLNEKLLETVDNVLALATADRTYAHLMRCQDRIEFVYTLDNSPALIDALVDLVQQVLEGMQLTDHTGKFRVGVALREALMNALYRGNLEISFDDLQASREGLLEGKQANLLEQRLAEPPFRDRKIHLQAQITRDEARFVIRDDGPGFRPDEVSSSGSGALSLDANRGRGLILMRSFMDEVTFNEQGNEVTLVKRRDVP